MYSLFRKVMCKAIFQSTEQSSKKETSLKSQYKTIIDIINLVKRPNFFAHNPSE